MCHGSDRDRDRAGSSLPNRWSGWTIRSVVSTGRRTKAPNRQGGFEGQERPRKGPWHVASETRGNLRSDVNPAPGRRTRRRRNPSPRWGLGAFPRTAYHAINRVATCLRPGRGYSTAYRDRVFRADFYNDTAGTVCARAP